MLTSRPPTVLIDASDIHLPSGGRTAVLGTFQAVFARETGWQYIVLVSNWEAAFDLPAVRQIVIPVRHRLIERLWIQGIVSCLAFRRRVDIVHFARTLGGYARPAKSILTVFDLTTILHPNLHTRTAVWYWRSIVPLHVRWADRIITISHNVAQDLVHKFRLPSDKIEVVYCAPQSIFDKPISPEEVDRISRAYRLPKEYLLFVGMLAKKKNLSTLIRALHILQREMQNCPSLVLAGRRYRQSDDTAIFPLIRSLGLESHVHYLGPVGDDELRGLYGGAAAFIFLSLHEGFGIPCLEALKCGVPLIAARSGAVPEIVGDAALLVDNPTDAYAVADAIRRVLEDTTLRRTMVEIGQARAAQFSWSRSANQVVALYRALLEDGRWPG